MTASDGRRRRVLLTDFGIARRIDDVSNLTDDNVAVGTVNYMAPEQLLGKPLDGRADQYALAATTFHLLTGAPPFHDSNRAVVISHHLGTSPPRISDRRPDLAHLDAVLARALAKDPDARYPSASTSPTPSRNRVHAATPLAHPQFGSQTNRAGLFGRPSTDAASRASGRSRDGTRRQQSATVPSTGPCRSSWCLMTRSTACLLHFRSRSKPSSLRGNSQTATRSRSVGSGTAARSTPTQLPPSRPRRPPKRRSAPAAVERRGKRHQGADAAGRRHSPRSSV